MKPRPSSPAALNRSVWFAWLTLAGIPGYVWCGLSHICMDGHLYHDAVLRRWYFDFIWATAFVAAAVLVLHSEVRRRPVPFALLSFLVLSRLVLASFGGSLFLVELSILIYLAVAAGLSLRRVRRQRQLALIDGKMPSSDEAACTQCGGLFQCVDMIAHEGHYACARCKPAFLQKLSEGARIEPAEHPRPA